MELRVRKVGTDALMVGDSTTRVDGEVVEMLPVLDSEEMEEWRAVGRLERKVCVVSTSRAGPATLSAFLAGVFREMKVCGKGMR